MTYPTPVTSPPLFPISTLDVATKHLDHVPLPECSAQAPNTLPLPVMHPIITPDHVGHVTGASSRQVRCLTRFDEM